MVSGTVRVKTQVSCTGCMMISLLLHLNVLSGALFIHFILPVCFFVLFFDFQSVCSHIANHQRPWFQVKIYFFKCSVTHILNGLRVSK